MRIRLRLGDSLRRRMRKWVMRRKGKDKVGEGLGEGVYQVRVLGKVRL